MTVIQQFDNRLLPLWADATLVTPAFVYDEARIVEKLALLAGVRERSGCRILYSIKALSFSTLLHKIADHVDGFSVSSVFEGRLAREVLGERGSVHLCSPGIRETDLSCISEYCDYVSFNSLSQWQRFGSQVTNVQRGLRINPGLSFVKDERYDPCRPGSKLGVPLAQLEQAGQSGDLLRGISGLHIHTNCEANDYRQLVETVDRLVSGRDGLMTGMQWLNLGGGYLLNEPAQLDTLCALVDRLTQEPGLRVFVEPGKAVVGGAGYLVASVIDMFDSGDRTIAVLDTTVNHLPEVFEYQYQPEVLQASRDGKYQYRLAGASCLSGDLFGDYAFDHRLAIGSRIIFANAGAYMLVKASMFNGINLPAVYALTAAHELRLEKKFDYAHYRDRL